tara:strand:- start:1631 stop:1936 length:306 start_codon:yes stop_codon:yes gene_type:complete
MTEEQLLQEARLEAENLYPYEGDIDYNYIESVREKFIQCYIANAKKQMSEAAEFLEWITTMDVDRIGATAGWQVDKLNDGFFSPIMTSQELYELFKQQKKE